MLCCAAMSDNDSNFADFLSTLAAVISESSLPQDVEKNLKEQQITTKDRLLLLDGDDLKELGFLMGPRKQILQWIRSQRTEEVDLSTTLRTISPSPSTSWRSAVPVDSVPSTPVRSSTPIGPVRSAAASQRKFQNFPIDELLQGKSTKTFDGSALVQHLKDGVMFNCRERSFVTKTVCRYLMAHCQNQDDPTMQEKMDMAESIVTTFPVLKDPLTGGYGEFCDPKSHSGYINYYVRTARSRSKDIATRWTHTKKRKLDAINDDDDDVRVLRERRPTASNRGELLQLMGSTREERRLWIASTSPSITDILVKYPRLQDIDTALKEEFDFIAPKSKSLMTEFQAVKPKILAVAGGSRAAASVVAELESGGSDEGEKSEVAFKSLVLMLRSPLKKGLKGPQPAPAACIGLFFNDCQDNSVEEAVVRLREQGVLQPCLFRTAGRYFLKCDNTSIPLPSASCFTEAVEYLFWSFWAFSVEYPIPLRFFYAFLEHLVGVGQKKNSVILRDLLRALNDA